MADRNAVLKLDYLAHNAPLAVAVKLDGSADGFDGGLLIEGIIAAAGVLVYHHPDGRITRELRPPEELERAASLSTLPGRPTTNDHPARLLSAADAREHQTGSVVGEGRWLAESEEVRGRMLLLDADAVEAFEGGKRCLSPGLLCDEDHTPGVWRGQPYDLVQRNIRYNHVAQVDRGREPRARARLDGAPAPDTETAMSTKKLVIGSDVVEIDADAHALIKAKLDAADKAAGEVTTLKAELATLKAKLDQMEAEAEVETMDATPKDLLDEMRGMLKALDAKIEAMRPGEGGDEKSEPAMDGDGMPDPSKMDAAVRERVALVGAYNAAKCDSLEDPIAASATDLKRAVIAARLPSLAEAAAKADGAELNGMYLAASSTTAAPASPGTQQLGRTLAPKHDAAQGAQPTSPAELAASLVDGYNEGKAR